jgi:general secretion pathway protein G
MSSQRCASCGAENTAESVVCAKCSAALTPPKAKRSATFWVVLAAVGCLGGIVVLGILATVIVPTVLRQFGAAQRAQAEVDIAMIDAAVREYALNNGGALPDPLEIIVTPDENGATYLVRTTLPLDPWKNAYVYVPGTGGEFTVTSYGKDGRPGGTGDDADITNAPTVGEER